MDINKRILDLLKKSNKTQLELSVFLGISASTLNNWLKLNRSIPSELIIPICEFFEVTANYILIGQDEKINNQLDKLDLLLLETFGNLSAENQLDVLAIIKQKLENQNKNENSENKSFMETSKNEEASTLDKVI